MAIVICRAPRSACGNLCYTLKCVHSGCLHADRGHIGTLPILHITCRGLIAFSEDMCVPMSNIPIKPGSQVAQSEKATSAALADSS